MPKEKYKEGMSEFDQSREAVSPEVQLIARMRLQRVVFGAFAIVLVTLFALGLSAYRHMQAEKKAAIDTAVDADAYAMGTRKAAERMERELQETQGTLSETRQALGLEKCRLALHEIRDGQLTRARALLTEAERLGPPPWAPLVARLTQDGSAKFDGSENSAAPVVCGSLSGDRQKLVIVRAVGDSLVVETYRAADGEFERGIEIPRRAGSSNGTPARLLLNNSGSAWYIPVGEHAYYGTRDEVLAVPYVPGGYDPERDQVTDVAGNADLSIVYEARGIGGLVRRSRMTDGNWLSERVDLDVQNPEVMAVCLAGDKPVILTPDGVFVVGRGGLTGLLLPLESRPEHAALHYGVGAIYSMVLSGTTLDLTCIKPGESKHVVSCRHEVPQDETEDLRFLSDDTPVWVGRSGRVIGMSFSSAQAMLLGGYTISFIERCGQGWLFGNRRGELSVRADESLRMLGEPLHMVPPQFVADPRANGFVLRAPGADVFVLHENKVYDLGLVADVAIAPQGPAWFQDARLHLPGGPLSQEEGKLLGAFADGSVLLFSNPQKLKHLYGGSIQEFLLPDGGRAPDPVVLSVEGSVAAYRIGGNIFTCDLQSDPEPVSGRPEISPNLMALDFRGEALALAYGATIDVRLLDGGELRTVRTLAAPQEIALLFGGTVLASLEAGELALYEVSTGREMLRVSADVSALCASGDGALHLIAGSYMLELNLQPDTD